MIKLDAALVGGQDLAMLWGQMVEMDRVFAPLVAEAETWGNISSTVLDSEELLAKQALLGMARIKINR